ncbi:hypothetical protein BaRGS_00029943 [Batillaria attramentaria]|uniref:Uncharacterized protein n=1 Tax=Batillaria attramentaria TaxID=370345 RepID=A0ABD0JVT0_9CAEN
MQTSCGCAPLYHAPSRQTRQAVVVHPCIMQPSRQTRQAVVVHPCIMHLPGRPDKLWLCTPVSCTFPADQTSCGCAPLYHAPSRQTRQAVVVHPCIMHLPGRPDKLWLCSPVLCTLMAPDKKKSPRENISSMSKYGH